MEQAVEDDSVPAGTIVCVPMDVDAFILNRPVCDSELTRIAPITQPDYLGLRPDKSQIKADILPHVDVTNSSPASINSRISVVESDDNTTVDPTRAEAGSAAPPLRQNRIGVYVHWSLPRLYRAGTGGADGVQEADAENQLVKGENRRSLPTFRPVPNRWLVVRNIQSSVPETPASEKRKAWIVESDRLWTVDELPDDVDLETDVSPYVSYSDGDEEKPDTLNRQAQYYIGTKFEEGSWRERGNDQSVRRIPLTVMNASNFCFADNATHNPNVFSIVDNLKYQDAQGNPQYLEEVTCDYVVVGWHFSIYQDPLTPKTSTHGFLSDRLHSLFLKSPRPVTYRGEARTISHGTIYNVRFERDKKPTIPSEEFAKLFGPTTKMEPVSVGTTGLDAVLSFLQAHESNNSEVFGDGATSVAKHLLALNELLRATEDDYDSRVKAADLLYSQNFTPGDGGRAWDFDRKVGPGESPAQPNGTAAPGESLSEIGILRKVNDLQSQLDVAKRKLKLKKWSLFSLWWSYVSDVNNADSTRRTMYKDLFYKYKDEARALSNLIATPTTGLEDQIEEIVRQRRFSLPPKVPVCSVPQPPFFQRRDPALCIAGMDPGWPTAYMGYVLVRFAHEISNQPIFSTGDNLSAESPIYGLLVNEALSTQEHGDLLGFKKWTGQPFVPLYIEWEAIYYHIPFEKWSVDNKFSTLTDNNHTHLRYGINETLYTNLENAADQRHISGRATLLPQPPVNLRALVEQVLIDPSVTLSTPEIDELKANIDKLRFSSAELSGLTSNLLTLSQGTHVQPNFEDPQFGNLPLRAALDAAKDLGFKPEDFVMIGDETGFTPYGGSMDFSASNAQPFKGVTHGQFQFTKLNIIDKFGQVICAVPPTSEAKSPTAIKETVYPCLGDQLSPGFAPGTNHLNTVDALTVADPNHEGNYPLCPFVQLTPAINQEVRINAEFLLQTVDESGEFSGWRTVDDWEQPVFAWIIVNFADNALQFFTGEGVFFVEMTLGGPNNTIQSPSWKPFNPPTEPESAVSIQLLQLIERMTDAETGAVYLRSFWNMITSAVELMPFAPGNYASYATSIVGKPFALVNTGFSLELSLPPLESQVIKPLQPSLHSPSEADLMYSYSFPLKIGDKDRPFDGVVGYFDADNATSGKTDFHKLHTYFTAKLIPEVNDPRADITPETFESLSPYYVDPEGPFERDTFTATHAAKLTVKTMIIDPYTSLHLYSPILPIKSFRLPAWTIQSAMEKMSAFFHVGPILLTRNLPLTFDPANALNADTWGSKQQDPKVNPESAAIRLPLGGGKRGVWNWLQPFPPDEAGGEKRYNAFDVGEEDTRLRLDPGPYTAVEGFLQLMQPLKGEDLG